MTIEELQEELLQLKEDLKTTKSENENFKNELENKDKRVKELEEYNQKLFLRATATNKEDKQQNEKFESKLLGDYVDFLNDEELELLKELEEEL